MSFRICANCKYYNDEVCVNSDSEYLVDFRLKNDTCDLWETLDPLVALKVMIYELKKAQMAILESGETNQSYMTGYISALSVVEGMIAEVENDGGNKSAV